MKKIEAIIRPERIPAAKKALLDAGFSGLTAYEVEGRGRQKGIALAYRTKEYRVDMIPKMKLELVVRDDDLEKALDTILSVTKTGEIGDGKIFVSTIDEVVRVRTGERGEEAI